MTPLKKILYTEVKKNYNDTNSLIFMGLILDQETCSQVTSFFEKEEKLVPEGSIVDYYDITDNVAGKNRRQDVLIVLKKDTPVNAMKRLNLSNIGVKWTSDFISNYRGDYYIIEETEE